MAKQTESNSPPAKPGRPGTTLWLCIIFFVSAWMFVLGVLVGRGTAPVHFDMEALQKELAALRDAVQKKEQQWYRSRSESTSGKPDLEFHEALKKSRIEPHLSLNAGPSEKAPQEPERAPLPEAKKPAESRPQPLQSASLPKFGGQNNAAGGNFTVQVAALKEVNLADAKVAELSRRGFPAYRATGTVPGQGTWHRVRIGSYKDRSEASRMLERLKKENIKGIIVNR